MNQIKEIQDYVFSRGPVVAVFGGSLGDEGKGKVSSLFEDVDYVAAPTGGGNAGHTVVCNGNAIALHELPGGSIIEKAKVYLGQGRVINITDMWTEIQELEDNGVNMKDQKIIISGNAQIIFNSLQRKLDMLIEELKSKAVGTTHKGIGPAYALKALRVGINFNILLNDEDRLKDFVAVNVKLFDGLDEAEIMEEIEREKDLLFDLMEQGYLTIDFSNMELSLAAKIGKRILIEASQSALLSIDGGMYPYCTSSDTSANGILSGLNIPKIDTVIGVFKAIKSKVGGGFFPTEIEDEVLAGEYRKKSGEFGATTGRPRQVGWMDLVEMRKVLNSNKVDMLFVTKADMLEELGNVKVGLKYVNKETGIEYENHIPTLESEYENLEVVYSKEFQLTDSMYQCNNVENMPFAYKDYFNYILDELNFDGKLLLGTGPDRGEFIVFN